MITKLASNEAGSLELKHKSFIDTALELIRFDEVELALKVLKSLPAVYRDNPIPEVELMKSDILAAMITPNGYMDSEYDSEVSIEQAKANIEHLLRAKILRREVDGLKDKKPHIIDYGPGEYWIPIGLGALGYSFSYKPIYMDQKAFKAAKPLIDHLFEDPKEGAPIIFVAQEVVEHMASPQDLSIEALRANNGRWPDYVHLSTPLYTFDVQEKNWNKPGGLPHLRAYTPQEFINSARSIFPGYNWEYRSDLVQSLRGYRVGKEILNGV